LLPASDVMNRAASFVLYSLVGRALGRTRIWPALHLEANRSGCLDDSFFSISSRRDSRRSVHAAIYAAALLVLAIWASGGVRQ
jgi:hypothetical protein